MDQHELVEFWRKSADHGVNAMDNLFSAGNYDWALFIGHLIVEKILKARWILDNTGGIPPKTHNLDKLARETRYPFSEEQLTWLVQASDFNLETRYPDYKMEFYKRATKDFAELHVAKVKELFECVQKTLL